MKKITALIISMATLWVAMSFTHKPDNNGKLTIVFDHYVGDKILQLDSATYINELDQPFTVTKFKYYIGNITLLQAGGLITLHDYYLVDEDEAETKKISLDIPPGQYSNIEFTIGVDSADNCSGAQTGALDPVNAMFWAWNTGYIFLKLEGKSPVSKSPGNVFEYHIGGYKEPAKCIRHISMSISRGMVVEVAQGKELHIKVDVAEILKNPTTIDISNLSSVTDFHNATSIADNYADMFSVSYFK